VEYDAVGAPFDVAASRVSRFEEAVHLIKGLWSDQPLTFDGKHYRIANVDGSPKPMQRRTRRSS
jgi:alkanesulfonate monooxygenase SsuD/methylene tetrahydromethanopterin reductase-like flavin-dependent oxidoreductase (luciferase family)